MDLSQPSLLFYVSFLFFLLMILVTQRKEGKSSKSLASELPPGPWKLPIIGSLHHLLSSLPHRRLRDLAQKHGPLMHLQMGQVSTVVVSSSRAAQEIMKNQDLSFADRPHLLMAEISTYGYKDMIFAPYGKYWRQVRKLCILELLTAKRVESFSRVREEEVSNLVHVISASCGSPINLTGMFSALASDITARAAFGEKSKSQELFLVALREMCKYGGGFEPADIFPSFTALSSITGTKSKMEMIFRKVDGIISSIIEEHRNKNKMVKEYGQGDDEENFVDVLLRLQQRGNLEVPIGSDNVKAMLVDMFTAGTHTSSTVLVWIMAELLKNPKIMAKAQDEVRQALRDKETVCEKAMQQLTYMKCVIKETLRLHPPLPLLLPRECRQSTLVHGYNIPAKTKVIVNAWAIGRDTRHWGKDAESFRPERFFDTSIDFKGANFEFIPFGAGRRMCPGISFGLATVELPLAQLLYHFNWKLPGGMKAEDLDIAEAFGVTVSLKSDLLLIPTRP